MLLVLVDTVATESVCTIELIRVDYPFQTDRTIALVMGIRKRRHVELEDIGSDLFTGPLGSKGPGRLLKQVQTTGYKLNRIKRLISDLFFVSCLHITKLGFKKYFK